MLVDRYKWGDNPLNVTLAATAKQLFSNKLANEMWSLARSGKPDTAFRPATGWGEGGLPPFLRYAPTTFARGNGDVAVFNYINTTRAFTVDLRDAGFSGDGKGVICETVWEAGMVASSRALQLTVTVEALSSTLLKCRRGKHHLPRALDSVSLKTDDQNLSGAEGYYGSKPHIVFLMADDLGHYDVGFRNPLIKSPVLDRLVTEEGLLLTRHYAYRLRGSMTQTMFLHHLRLTVLTFPDWNFTYILDLFLNTVLRLRLRLR